MEKGGIRRFMERGGGMRSGGDCGTDTLFCHWRCEAESPSPHSKARFSHLQPTDLPQSSASTPAPDGLRIEQSWRPPKRDGGDSLSPAGM